MTPCKTGNQFLPVSSGHIGSESDCAQIFCISADCILESGHSRWGSVASWLLSERCGARGQNMRLAEVVDAPCNLSMRSDMSDNKQNRRFVRIETDALVDYTGSEILLFHKIENLSLGGLSIHTPTLEEVGTNVFLALNFPDLNEAIEVEGEVVWVHEEDPKEMGIRFFGLTDAAKAVLQRYIDARSSR